MIYLTISEGDSGDATQPLVATTDLAIINAVIRELAKRVRGDSEPLRLARVRSPGEPIGSTE